MASRRTEKQNMLKQYEKEMEEMRQQEEIERREYEEWYEEWISWHRPTFEREYDYDDFDDFDDYDDYEGGYAYGYWA